MTDKLIGAFLVAGAVVAWLLAMSMNEAVLPALALLLVPLLGVTIWAQVRCERSDDR